MNADPMTLTAAAAVAALVVAVVFTITTLQRHDDRPNRLAASSLLATFLGLVAGPALGGLSGDTEAADVAAVLLVAGLAGGAWLLWNAAQAFAGRTPDLAASVAAGVVGGLTVMTVAVVASEWVLVPSAVLASAGWLLAARELRQSPMASNLNSVVLFSSLLTAVPIVVVAAGLAGMSNISLAAAWSALAGVGGALTVVAGMAVMALRVERYGNWWTLGEDQDRFELGIDEKDVFISQARDRVDRCHNVGQPVHVIATSLPGLDDLNLAYGHLAGDAALRWVAELLRRQAPATAVIGHLGAGRFAIVTSRPPELVANAVQNGMMRVPPPDTLPVRLTPVFAWSSSEEAGYDFDTLRRTAEERLTHVA